MGKVSKYRAVKAKVDGITFDSKKEAAYYGQLKLRFKAGDIRYFLRQVAFDLPGNVKYRVDFTIFENDGGVRHIDVKGMETPMFKVKKKMVEALYPVEIEVVK